MRRVLIMGPPGAGKSTLARDLARRLGLPVFHLDQAYWQPGWVPAPDDRFRAEVERIVRLSAWVIDGNYTATIDARLSAADTVIYLDVPTWLCVLRLFRRILFGYGRVRGDAAIGCPERLDLTFLRFAWSWTNSRRARNLALIDGFQGRRVILRTRLDRRLFLAVAS